MMTRDLQPCTRCGAHRWHRRADDLVVCGECNHHARAADLAYSSRSFDQSTIRDFEFATVVGQD